MISRIHGRRKVPMKNLGPGSRPALGQPGRATGSSGHFLCATLAAKSRFNSCLGSLHPAGELRDKPQRPAPADEPEPRPQGDEPEPRSQGPAGNTFWAWPKLSEAPQHKKTSILLRKTTSFRNRMSAKGVGREDLFANLSFRLRKTTTFVQNRRFQESTAGGKFR